MVLCKKNENTCYEQDKDHGREIAKGKSNRVLQSWSFAFHGKLHLIRVDELGKLQMTQPPTKLVFLIGGQNLVNYIPYFHNHCQ